MARCPKARLTRQDMPRETICRRLPSRAPLALTLTEAQTTARHKQLLPIIIPGKKIDSAIHPRSGHHDMTADGLQTPHADRSEPKYLVRGVSEISLGICIRPQSLDALSALDVVPPRPR